MSNSKKMYSVGAKGLSYFLNRTKEGSRYRYTLCKVLLPEKSHLKVTVNKGILLELQSMRRKTALTYCRYLTKTRKKISMSPKGERNGKQEHVRGVA